MKMSCNMLIPVGPTSMNHEEMRNGFKPHKNVGRMCVYKMKKKGSASPDTTRSKTNTKQMGRHG
ncbi:hypothetical protein Hanom_Chr14g01267711 [Helianthus anomalus]